MAKAKTPIGTLIDSVWRLREEKRTIQKDLEAVEGKIAEAENEIIARLDAERTDRAASRRASVHISENIVANTKDWDEFMLEEVVKKKQIHLVERRPSTLACREIWEQGKSLRGLEPYTKRKLNIRTLDK